MAHDNTAGKPERRPNEPGIPAGFKLRHTLRGHEGVIRRIAWSPHGRRIASPSTDATVRLWDAETGELLETLRGHTQTVYCVAWSPDGRSLASGSWDSTIRLWRMKTRDTPRILMRQAGLVNALAWSPDARFLAVGTENSTIQLWDARRGEVGRVFVGQEGNTNNLAWSPKGQMIAAASGDDNVRVWHVDCEVPRHTLRGHLEWAFSVAWSPDGHLVASGSWDRTVRQWDVETGRQVNILEGHTARISSISFSPDGRLVASKASDHTVRLWRCDTSKGTAFLSEPSSGRNSPSLAFHPASPVLATLGRGEYGPDTVIRIWDLDLDALLGAAPPAASVHYSNAKVVLVGDSGVGKTGLGLVLSGQSWKPTESSHGRHVWSMDDEIVRLGDEREITRETLLWDLAGQPGYRIVHQLSLTEVAVALVVFDARSETDPFAGVRHWDRALRQAQKAAGANAPPLKKYLVAARIDRGGLSVSKDRIDKLVEKYGFDGFFETSAKEGTNTGDLLDRIKAAIEWDALSSVSSNELFQNIKKFLLAEKKEGRLICAIDDLLHRFHDHGEIPEAYHAQDLEAEFRTCIGLVEGRGLIRRLNFGDLVLLQPELLDAYAACLINAAKTEPDGLGCIAEEDARARRFSVPHDERIKDKEQEMLLLIAMVDDLLRHEIALRENGDLVFPSQFTRQHPDLPDPEGKEVVFRLEGAVLNIYATLVVRLAHSGMLTLRSQDMWRNAAVFGSAAGGRFGLALAGDIDEGWGDLTLFYQNDADDALRLQFEQYVHAHLQRRALPGTVHRRRIFACSDCGTGLSEAQSKRAKERGKKEILCPVCDTPIPLVEREERVRAAAEETVADMDRRADAGRERAAAVSVIDGKLATNDFDVFLCHNSEDKPAVKAIGAQLKEKGILPWLDEWNLRPGLPWQRALEEQIENIKSAAVFVGSSGMGPWQEMELQAFLREFVNRGCPVIPLILQDAPATPKLPVFLRGMGWVDFRKAEPDPLEQLIWGITGERGQDLR